MLLLLALATVVSGNVLPFMYYSPYGPYGGAPSVYHYPPMAPRVYTHQYMTPIVQHQPQPVVHQQIQQRALPDDGFIYEDEPEGRFLFGEHKEADFGDGVGAGTMKGRVNLYQNPFIPDDGAYLTITIDDGIERDVDYHLALVPAASVGTACAVAAVQTPANNAVDPQAIDNWTTAFLGGTAPTAANYANLGVFRATGAIDPFKLKAGLNYHNLDGMGANFDAGMRYPSTFVAKYQMDRDGFQNTAGAASATVNTNTAIASAMRADVSGMVLVVWKLTASGANTAGASNAGGLFAAKTAGNFGCATIPT